MDIDWTKIKEGFRGFEKLAVEFVQENEKSQKSRWKKTKDTRDENHDAILAKKIKSQKLLKWQYLSDIQIILMYGGWKQNTQQ